MATVLRTGRSVIASTSKERLIRICLRRVVTKMESAEQFNAVIRDAAPGRLLVVDYYADWCVPCRRMGPVFERLSNEYAEECEFVAFDIEKMGGLAKQMQILSIPTFDFIRDKKLFHRITGELPQELEQKIAQFTQEKSGE